MVVAERPEPSKHEVDLDLLCNKGGKCIII